MDAIRETPAALKSALLAAMEDMQAGRMSPAAARALLARVSAEITTRETAVRQFKEALRTFL